MTKVIIGIVTVVVIVCFGVPMLLLSAVFGGSGGCAPAIPNASGQPPGIGRWQPDQIAIAVTILQVGTTKSVPRWGKVIALATAMQESELRNLPHLGEHNDHDSIGVFQQRPSQGWGTPEQLADPAYQAGAFYDRLLKVDGWQQMPLTQASQSVQRSAYPDAYTKWTHDAILLADLLSSADVQTSPGAIGFCGATGPWMQPVQAKVVSGFHTPERPSHHGVDLGAARGTPIRAASAGTVIAVRCNVVPESHGCDQDGHPVNVKGCGWYVDIEHAEGVFTRSCHMLTKPYVEEGDKVVVGQVIGIVGSSGHSSGPHLHWEVLLGDRSSASAVDPVSFMEMRGAPLGTPG